MAQLEIRGLYKAFGAVKVAQDLNLTVERGDALGIIGPNGAGKTTFFNMIAGDMPSDAGAISFNGVDVTRWKARRRARAGVARTFQVPQAFSGMTVFENVMVGAIFAGGQPQRKARTTSSGILEQTNLDRFANTQAGSLTLLNRKRLELARALSTAPQLLLLDEIAGGLTDAECSELVETVNRINAGGVTVIWIEHVLHALVSSVRRLAVLNGGQFIRQGEPREVMDSADVREIYLGVGPETTHGVSA
jgi:branched-chain amino acid transport system ATP-binding protein